MFERCWPYPNEDNWTLLTFVGTGNKIDLYVNCSFNSTNANYIDLPLTEIGRRVTGGGYLKADLDEPRVYDAALNSSQISRLCDLPISNHAAVIKVDFSDAGDTDGGSLLDWNQITSATGIGEGAVKRHGDGAIVPGASITLGNFHNSNFNNDPMTANWSPVIRIISQLWTTSTSTGLRLAAPSLLAD